MNKRVRRQTLTLYQYSISATCNGLLFFRSPVIYIFVYHITRCFLTLQSSTAATLPTTTSWPSPRRCVPAAWPASCREPSRRSWEPRRASVAPSTDAHPTISSTTSTPVPSKCPLRKFRESCQMLSPVRVWPSGRGDPLKFEGPDTLLAKDEAG